MALERQWESVAPTNFIADGTAFGLISVDDTKGFMVKQNVYIKATGLPTLSLQVKRVIDQNQLIVGPRNNRISPSDFTDISQYTILLNAQVGAAEQDKNNIPDKDHYSAIYEADPVVADRVILVNPYGQKIDSVVDSQGKNRLAVDGQFTAEVDVTVNVDIDALTPPNQADPDSILIAGSEDGTKGGLKHAARVDSELDLRVGISDGANKAQVNALGELSVTDADAATLLASIDAGIPASLGQTTMANSMPVTIASNQPPIPVTAVFPDEPMKISGTIDGTPTGTEYGYVYNIRQQILAAHDRTQDITYADFGTKNQRITQIDYASPTFIGVIARKVISYTLVGNNYRRDSINWVII